jgi:hypothetical protein
VLPRCRFLTYLEPGGDMQPHVDLSKQLDEYDPRSAAKSTHTFMVHLADCSAGGETVFLTRLNAGGGPQADSTQPQREERQQEQEQEQEEEEGGGLGAGVLGSALPQRGRLVIFPHECPHAGLPVLDVPKKFLRGELLIQ